MVQLTGFARLRWCVRGGHLSLQTRDTDAIFTGYCDSRTVYFVL